MTYTLRSWGILCDTLGLTSLPDDLGVDASGNFVEFEIVSGPVVSLLNGEAQSRYTMRRVSDGVEFDGFFRLEPV